MEILIRPNWATGRLEQVPGFYRFGRILDGGRTLRFNTDVSTFNINDKIYILTEDGTEARAQIRTISIGFPLGFVIDVVLLSGRFSSDAIRNVSLIDDNTLYELDGEIDIQLNIKIFDLKEIKRSSTFTSQFEIPFTENNNKILTQLFNINVDDGYNWNKKSDMIITDGGALISTGYLQIEEIDWSDRLYKCIFYGDNKNLFDDIGDNFIFGNADFINDIDFTDVIHSVSEENVLRGWNNEVPYVYSIIQDDVNNFTKQNFTTGIEPHRWKMWYNSKDLFDRIFRKWGYIYESDFLNSDFFKKHKTIGRTDNFSGGEIIKWNNQITTTSLGLSGSSVIPLSDEIINILNATYDTLTGRFRIGLKGDYYGNALLSFGERINYDVDARTPRDRAWIGWDIFRDGVKIGEGRSKTFEGGKIGERQVVSPNGRFDTVIPARNSTIEYVWIKDEPLFNGSYLKAGDEIKFYLEYAFSVNYNMIPNAAGNPVFTDENFSFISISSSKTAVNPAVGFYNIKQIDFIGDIFKQFNLYIKPSKINRREFLIEPRDAFYEGGGVVDFLEFDESNDVIIGTLNNLSAKNWKFTYKKGDDVYNELYQERFNDRVFGDALIRLDNDFLNNEKVIELNAMPVIYSKVFDNVILPDIEGGKKSEQLRYGLYSGTQSFEPSFNAVYNFPIPLVGPPTPYGYYPLITNYSDGISAGETILYATNNSSGGARERSLYFNYWENEIETYAEPSSHILRISCRFNTQVYSKIDFDDIFWIELNGAGRYYTLLEINNWNPRETSLVELVFLTYLDKKEAKPRSRFRFIGNEGGDTISPSDTGFGNSPIPIRRDDGRFYPIDDLIMPNSPIRGNGWNIRGRDVVFTGVNEYGTVVGDNITVFPDADRIWIAGDNMIIGNSGSNAFVWNANDVNVDANVVSWGAVGKTHSIDNSFLFNEFNPVLDSKDQASITNSDEGTMVWNAVEETLYISKNNVWLPVGGGGGTDYINIFDFTSNSTTMFFAAGVFEILNMVSTVGFSQGDLSDDGNGKITYTGSSPTRFRLQGIASGSSGPNNEIHFAFFKNGLLWPCSEQSGIAGPGGRATAVPFQCVVELDNTDDIQVYVMNSSGTTAFTLQNINVIIERI